MKCFLMKTAIAIPLQKSKKRKTNIFLRGSCFQGIFIRKQEGWNPYAYRGFQPSYSAIFKGELALLDGDFPMLLFVFLDAVPHQDIDLAVGGTSLVVRDKMQLVQQDILEVKNTVITERNKKGELWLSPPNTEARKLESAWSSENRLKRWVRNFDSNLLQCDDTTIIELILEHVLNTKPILEIENCRCNAS